MAELAKKIHMINRSGTAQTAKIYSTTAEVGNHWLFANVDGVPAYVPIGDINDGRATSGRVKGSGGDTFAILNSGKPPYTEMQWTTPGTYTWTCPQGVTRIRVAVCGGGGNGGARTGVLGNGRYQNGNSGSSSSAFEVVATGGIGGGWDKSTSVNTSAIGQAGTPNGYNGNYSKNNYSGRTLGFACSFSKTNGNYGYGAGGYNSTDDFYAYGGGSGGYNSTYLNVIPLTTYTIIVGRGGTAYTLKNTTIEAGGGGFVLIAFGGDI